SRETPPSALRSGRRPAPCPRTWPTLPLPARTSVSISSCPHLLSQRLALATRLLPCPVPPQVPRLQRQLPRPPQEGRPVERPGRVRTHRLRGAAEKGIAVDRGRTVAAHDVTDLFGRRARVCRCLPAQGRHRRCVQFDRDLFVHQSQTPRDGCRLPPAS